MSVKQQMIRILRSDETGRINFSFTGTSGSTITVTPAGFRLVAGALEKGDISVVEGHFEDDRAMYSAWADTAKGTAANTFYLGKNPRYSRRFNALIVHEAVHAIYDLNRLTIPWVDNEAAAYIAQAYYARNSGLAQSEFEPASHPSIAYYIVTGMRGNNASDIAYFLTALRDSLDASPQYHDYIRTSFTGDG